MAGEGNGEGGEGGGEGGGGGGVCLIGYIRLQVELSLIVNSGTGKGMDTNTSWAKEPVLADRDVTEVDGLACQCSNQTSWVTQLCFEVTNPRGGHYR